MKNLRNLLAMITFTVLLTIGASTAKAGILMSDLKGSDTPPACIEGKANKTDWGILMSDFTGIIITGFTGIIITSTSDTPVDCGILMSD